MSTVTVPFRYHTSLFAYYTRSDLPGTFAYIDQDFTANGSYSDSWTRNSNPNWKQTIAAGGDASSGYSTTRIQWNPLTASGSANGVVIYGNPDKTFSSWITNYRDYWDTGYLVSAGDDGVLMDQALGRLKRKLAKHNEATNVLVPIAEIGELRGTIKKSFSFCEDFINAIIHHKQTGGVSTLKFISDAWLNFSFGISPMIADIQNTCDAIQNYMNSKSHTAVLKGSASRQWVSSIAPFASTGMFGAELWRSCVAQHSLSYVYIAGFSINTSASNSYSLGSRFGLEFGAIIPTAWELVPYSWLIDYFTTVGHYLDDVFISASGITRYVVLCRKYTCRMDQFGSFRGNNKDTKYFSGSVSPAKFTFTSFTRTPLSGLPHVALRVKTVDEIGRNALKRLLNLSSLLYLRKLK